PQIEARARVSGNHQAGSQAIANANGSPVANTAGVAGVPATEVVSAAAATRRAATTMLVVSVLSHDQVSHSVITMFSAFVPVAARTVWSVGPLTASMAIAVIPNRATMPRSSPRISIGTIREDHRSVREGCSPIDSGSPFAARRTPSVASISR